MDSFDQYLISLKLEYFIKNGVGLSDQNILAKFCNSLLSRPGVRLAPKQVVTWCRDNLDWTHRCGLHHRPFPG